MSDDSLRVFVCVYSISWLRVCKHNTIHLTSITKHPKPAHPPQTKSDACCGPAVLLHPGHAEQKHARNTRLAKGGWFGFGVCLVGWLVLWWCWREVDWRCQNPNATHSSSQPECYIRGRGLRVWTDGSMIILHLVAPIFHTNTNTQSITIMNYTLLLFSILLAMRSICFTELCAPV